MYSFCFHCGQSIDQEQVPGQALMCKHCGKQIGVVEAPQKAVDQTEELIRGGTAARCPHCRQVVEVKVQGPVRSFATHYAASPQRKICSGSGKPIASDPPAVPSPPRTSSGKDLSKFMTRESIRVVSCKRTADPLIEELTLEYLDKSDRVRIQIEALRDILGAAFRMQAYPPSLGRPELAVWGNDTACVVARKHERGGYQQLTDGDIKSVVEDLRRHKELFYS
jgi:DNA-directed RNA polymerase subunit RPC12/RpoP